MKETNKALLQDLILGEKNWGEPSVVQAMAEDPSFAEAARAAAKTLGVLEQHGLQLDDVDMSTLPVTEQHRSSARARLAPRPRSTFRRHSIWLIPSAAAAVLAFAFLQKGPSTQGAPNNATLGGRNEGIPPLQRSTNFANYDLGDTLGEGVFTRIEVYATDMDVEPLFTTGHILKSDFEFTPEQKGKLQVYERVWVVIEWVQPAGHARTSPGQWLSR
ncbi:MAG: hypothetical protein ACI9X4_000108 [Glaciecola sp.]|jgi:hypothetical protein